jgi:hypothetical protein
MVLQDGKILSIQGFQVTVEWHIFCSPIIAGFKPQYSGPKQIKPFIFNQTDIQAILDKLSLRRKHV